MADEPPASDDDPPIPLAPPSLPPLILVRFPGTSPGPLLAFLRGLGYATPGARPDAAGGTEDWGVEGLSADRVVVASPAYDDVLAGRIEQTAARILVLTRDPRTALCWLASESHANPTATALGPTGSADGPDLADALAAQLAGLTGWRDRPDAVLVRSEQLPQPRQGGEEVTLIRTLLGLAAWLGWRGSGFRLTRALLASRAPSAQDGLWDVADDAHVGSTVLQGHACSPALLDQAAAWGYPISLSAAQPPEVTAPDVLFGLLAALANEYDDLEDELHLRHWEGRRELLRMERIARRLQEKLASARGELRPGRRYLAALGSWAARILR